MTIKPILFNTDMVRAILDGRKTVTRRIVKPQPNGTFDQYWGGFYDNNEWILLKEPYRPGDILYVRETWRLIDFDSIDTDYWSASVQYKADMAIGERWHDLSPDMRTGWRPSIHMPREAARIWLRVTDVRVERLQDSFTRHGSAIFELETEGIEILEDCRECVDTYGSPCCIDSESECGNLDEVRGKFANLWDDTIKPSDRSGVEWSADPWVWRIKFERCEKPKGADDV